MADEAKSRTQVAQLTTAAVVAVVLLFLTKPLQYLPNAVLSAVVFMIGLKLIDVADMRAIYRLRRDEFFVALATAVVVVCVGVEQGIILAIILSVVLHVKRHYEPNDAVVSCLAEVDPAPRWLVLDAEAIDDVDYTGGQTLAELADGLAERRITFAVAAAGDHLRAELGRFGVTERIGADRIFPTIAEAVTAFRASSS
jgi:MFS superfamily sulfate permease-like transporter